MASTLEMRLLVQCLPHDHPSSRGTAPDLSSADWPAVIRTAKAHGMVPLLASYLLPFSRNWLGVPKAVVDVLQMFQERHLIRSMTQIAALVELQREFNRDHLRVVAWKGPSIGMLLYGSARLRPSVDLDFLFVEADLPKLLHVLDKLEYRLLGSTDSASKDHYVLSMQGEFTFGRDRDKSVLEFHLQILPSRFSLWQDAEIDVERASTSYPVAGVELLLQRPEDLLVSLCAHATKHDWDQLKWSVDIVQFLKLYGNTLNWPAFLADLQRTRKEAVVLLGLSLAAELFLVQLPPDVRNALGRTPTIVALAQGLAVHIMNGSVEPVTDSQRRSIIAILCPRLRDRIAYTLRPIVELNYQDLRVPIRHRTFFFLNYGFRFFRLLRKYGTRRLATKTSAAFRSIR